MLRTGLNFFFIALSLLQLNVVVLICFKGSMLFRSCIPRNGLWWISWLSRWILMWKIAFCVCNLDGIRELLMFALIWLLFVTVMLLLIVWFPNYVPFLVPFKPPATPSPVVEAPAPVRNSPDFNFQLHVLVLRTGNVLDLPSSFAPWFLNISVLSKSLSSRRKFSICKRTRSRTPLLKAGYGYTILYRILFRLFAIG